MSGVEGTRSGDILTMERQNPSIRDLSRELDMSPIGSNRIVERFLFNLIITRDINCGEGCAGDINRYMKRKDIPVPHGKVRLKWINRQIWDVCRNPSKHFKVIEIDGTLTGINFKWWYLDGKTQPEINAIGTDIRNLNPGDINHPDVCNG